MAIRNWNSATRKKLVRVNTYMQTHAFKPRLNRLFPVYSETHYFMAAEEICVYILKFSLNVNEG